MLQAKDSPWFVTLCGEGFCWGKIDGFRRLPNCTGITSFLLPDRAAELSDQFLWLLTPIGREHKVPLAKYMSCRHGKILPGISEGHNRQVRGAV